MTILRTAGILLSVVTLLLVAPPSEASIQCGTSDEDPSIRIEPVPVDGLLPPGDPREGEPVAAFRISGVRPKRIMRIGIHSWRAAKETPQRYRDGYSSECWPFEHFVLVWVRESGSKRPGELRIQYQYVQYQYVSGEKSILDSQVSTLEVTGAALHHFKALSSPATVPLEADLPVWGVFVGVSPKAGESIAETAARADRALVLHIQNSEY